MVSQTGLPPKNNQNGPFLVLCLNDALAVSCPLRFLSGDEREPIGGRQGSVRRPGSRREHHAGQRVHSDEGVGSAKPQQSDLHPPPQPEASGGIRAAPIPR